MNSISLKFIGLFEDYIKERMRQKEADGLIISREIIEEIFQELRQSYQK